VVKLSDNLLLKSTANFTCYEPFIWNRTNLRVFRVIKGGVSISAVGIDSVKCLLTSVVILLAWVINHLWHPIVALPVRILMRIFLGIFRDFHISLMYFPKRAFRKTTVIESCFQVNLVSAVDLMLEGSEAKIYCFSNDTAFCKLVQRHSYLGVL